MIDLAPNSKRGLELAGPLILAGGFGNEFERTLISRAHALVTSPVSLRAHAPARGETRVLEFPGGFLLHKANANPGLAAVLRAHRLIWRRIELVIILSLAGQDWMHWGQIARRASQIESIGALELEIVEESDARQLVAAVRAETDLPIVAKVPLEGVLERAAAALEGGADALTIGLAPLGSAFTVGQAWDGRLAGPVVKPLALRAVRTIVGSFPETPLIAAGGVQTASDVRDFLEAGARAAQVDTALWRDPEVLMEIAKGPLE